MHEPLRKSYSAYIALIVPSQCPPSPSRGPSMQDFPVVIPTTAEDRCIWSGAVETLREKHRMRACIVEIGNVSVRTEIN